MNEHYDAAVIGTGQAGPALANRLSQAGWKIAVIERGRFGGTCVNTGCMPTKTLVASAYAARLAARAAEYGVVIDGHIGIDMAKVKARKDAVSTTASKNIEAWLRSMPGVTVYQAHARFISAREIAVGAERVSADKVFIDVGGRAIVPAIPGLDAVSYLTSTSILELDAVPGHLIVLGGSYIGLEFAQIFRRFGARVTVIEGAPRLVVREDEDVSDAIRDILEREQIDIELESMCTRVEKTDAGVRVAIEAPAGRREIVGSHLLLAVGRRPNTDDLGLDAAGVETDQRGFIVTDDMLRTSVPSIWALGECNGRGAFTHTAYNDFEIVAGNLLDNESPPCQRPHADLRPLYRPATRPCRHDGARGARERQTAARGDAAYDAGRARGGARGDAGLHEGRGRRSKPKGYLARRSLALPATKPCSASPRLWRRTCTTRRCSARCSSTPRCPSSFRHCWGAWRRCPPTRRGSKPSRPRRDRRGSCRTRDSPQS